MLSVVQITEDGQWDTIVKSFIDYDVYYLSEYTKAFLIHGDGVPILFLYEDKNIRAMNVVMKRDIEKEPYFTGKIPPNTWFDMTTPYGYGGFLIEGAITEEGLKRLDEEYSAYCNENGMLSEFVRFHPVLHNSSMFSSNYDITELGETITMRLNSKELIWMDLTSKNRNMIRKAQKSGVKIYWGRNPQLLQEFIPLYNQTMDKDGAKSYYYFKKDFYDSLLEDIKYNSMIFYAVFHEKIISMSILLFANRQMHYHLSASDRAYQQLAPTNLLLYEAACWGCDNGYKTFHLGGGLGSREDSLFQFKKAFNRNSNSCFSIGRKIFDQKKYHELVEIRKNDPSFVVNTSFFPLYRG